MRIGVGSRNKAKLIAAQRAIEIIRKSFFTDSPDKILFFETDTRTSVPEMPLTLNELMQGALERALFVYDKFDNINFSIGLEGGVFRSDSKSDAFLQSWAYVYDGSRGYYGSSGALTLPDKISHALYHEKQELSDVIDSISGKNDVRSNEGTFGILTGNAITRSQSFETAIVAALTPLFNKSFY